MKLLAGLAFLLFSTNIFAALRECNYVCHAHVNEWASSIPVSINTHGYDFASARREAIKQCAWVGGTMLGEIPCTDPVMSGMELPGVCTGTCHFSARDFTNSGTAYGRDNQEAKRDASERCENFCDSVLNRISLRCETSIGTCSISPGP